jgi:hypothetical protein
MSGSHQLEERALDAIRTVGAEDNCRRAVAEQRLHDERLGPVLARLAEEVEAEVGAGHEDAVDELRVVPDRVLRVVEVALLDSRLAACHFDGIVAQH